MNLRPHCSRLLPILFFLLSSSILGCTREDSIEQTQRMVHRLQHNALQQSLRLLKHPVRETQIDAARRLGHILKPQHVKHLARLLSHIPQVYTPTRHQMFYGIARMGPNVWLRIAQERTRWELHLGPYWKLYLRLRPDRSVLQPLAKRLRNASSVHYSTLNNTVRWKPALWPAIGQIWRWAQNDERLQSYIHLFRQTDHIPTRAALLLGLSVSSQEQSYTFPKKLYFRSIWPVVRRTLHTPRAQILSIASVVHYLHMVQYISKEEWLHFFGPLYSFVLKRWKESLESVNLDVRVLALEALANLPPQYAQSQLKTEILQELIEHLKSKEQRTRYFAAKSLFALLQKNVHMPSKQLQHLYSTVAQRIRKEASSSTRIWLIRMYTWMAIKMQKHARTIEVIFRSQSVLHHIEVLHTLRHSLSQQTGRTYPLSFLLQKILLRWLRTSHIEQQEAVLQFLVAQKKQAYWFARHIPSLWSHLNRKSFRTYLRTILLQTRPHSFPLLRFIQRRQLDPQEVDTKTIWSQIASQTPQPSLDVPRPRNPSTFRRIVPTSQPTSQPASHPIMNSIRSKYGSSTRPSR